MSLRLHLAVLVLVLPYAAALAQGVGDLIKSPAVPETIDLKNIPPDFRAVTLKSTGGEINPGMSEIMMFSMSSMASDGSDRGRMLERYSLSTVSWTSGQTVKCDSGDFLVTYKLIPPSVTDPHTAAPPEVLHLVLVRRDSVVEITLRPDVTRERMAALVQPQGPGIPPAGAKTQALSNLKQITLGMLMYQGDYDDIVPYVQDTKSAFAVTQPYMKNTALLKSQNPSGSRILMNMSVAGVSVAEVPSPAETIFFYDEKPWPDGMHLVSYMDGHAKFESEENWRRIEKTLHLKLKHTGKPLPPNYWKTIAPGADLG